MGIINRELGAAGCKETVHGHFCSFIEKGSNCKFLCKRYNVDLTIDEKSNQPWRSTICADNAEKEAWSKIYKMRQMQKRQV